MTTARCVRAGQTASLFRFTALCLRRDRKARCNKMAKFCSEPSCPGIAVTGRFCEKHKTDNYERRRDAARSLYDRWYGLAAWCGPYGSRGYHLRHFPMCENDSCGKPATDVHHIDDSWKQTGDWRAFIDQNNLQSLCHEHHSEITMKRNQERGLICKSQ